MELPGIHDAADKASGQGQRRYLRLSATRLIALLFAAVVGAAAIVCAGLAWLGWLMVLCFGVAAFAEMALIAFQPERDWYAGRAIAESTKTLAWRYAVGGEPFPKELESPEADQLLLERVTEVVDKAKDRLSLGTKPAVLTPSMKQLRASAFDDRRSAYLNDRTQEQRLWYSEKGDANKQNAFRGRALMLVGEFGAIVAAFIAINADRLIDFASIVATLVASVAAWVAIKQYSQLASAYRVAAMELALQESVLASVSEQEWPQAVADAEEAISREHTMWLASRGGEQI